MEYENDQRGYDGLSLRSVALGHLLTDDAQTSLAATNASAAGHRVVNAVTWTTRAPAALLPTVAIAGMF